MSEHPAMTILRMGQERATLEAALRHLIRRSMTETPLSQADINAIAQASLDEVGTTGEAVEGAIKAILRRYVSDAQSTVWATEIVSALVALESRESAS